jgi:hypothetical protein
MNILQIVPGLPPNLDGIGDYALRLAEELHSAQAIESSFLVGRPGNPAAPYPGMHTVAVQSRSAASLVSALQSGFTNQPSHVLLHFSPYGYQHRGVPAWIVAGLHDYVAHSSVKLSICFHELDVTGLPPWRSGFWAAPLQRRLLKQLLKLAHYAYTNTEEHRYRLESLGEGRVALIPNFSTIPRISSGATEGKRRRYIVVFGRAGHRRHIYQLGTYALDALCTCLQIERVLDIGDPIDGFVTTHFGPATVVQCGALPAAEVSRIMSESAGLFISYPAPLLLKSSVYAAACAHGLVTFLHDDSHPLRSCAGLLTDTDFVPLPLTAAQVQKLDLDGLSSSILSRYKERSVQTAASTIARALKDLS